MRQKHPNPTRLDTKSLLERRAQLRDWLANPLTALAAIGVTRPHQLTIDRATKLWNARLARVEATLKARQVPLDTSPNAHTSTHAQALAALRSALSDVRSQYVRLGIKLNTLAMMLENAPATEHEGHEGNQA